ncbi:hypothetical protein SLEP1_g13248 [Rubroshorea leprosula]|uniref:Uncharacterized protein n=1 Tax=Rubroshorea leprosula TaxID=152421 RepID=A0AAV5IQR3_9ROSI|nr:hypothetical protein SLEP1_g13248 [Rubroshorea leprosula]
MASLVVGFKYFRPKRGSGYQIPELPGGENPYISDRSETASMVLDLGMDGEIKEERIVFDKALIA